MRSEEEIREILAALEHEQWSDWVSRVIATEDHISPTRVMRWERLSKTPYRDLTEQEKNADRYWAQRVLDKLDWHSLAVNDKPNNIQGEKSGPNGRE